MWAGRIGEGEGWRGRSKVGKWKGAVAEKSGGYEDEGLGFDEGAEGWAGWGRRGSGGGGGEEGRRPGSGRRVEEGVHVEGRMSAEIGFGIR